MLAMSQRNLQEEDPSEGESSDTSSSDSSDSISGKNHSRKKKSRNKVHKNETGIASGKLKKNFKELEIDILKKKLEELTKTPKGSRKVDRQLFDKDGNEIVTPKVTNPKKSATGTSSSKKRKHHDDSDGSQEAEDVDATISMIEKKYLTPTKAADSESDDDNQHEFLESSAIKAELGSRTSKRLKKCHENYTSKGPPVLGENPTVEIFYAWKANLKIFIERMPGYVNGMLKKRPDFDNLNKTDQKMLIEVYQNIMVWLAKAGCDNRKVNNKTKGVSMKPYPDIVGWWKSVNDIFALSQITLDNMKSKLHAVYQFKGEKLVSYYTRFETKVNELKDLGMELKSSKMGVILFKGLLGFNRRTVSMFLSENRVKCSLTAMSSICKWLDDLDEDRHPDRPEDEKMSVHLAQANTERMTTTPEKYGPGERTVTFEQPRIGYQTNNQSGRGRNQFRGGRGGPGRGRGYDNGASRGNGNQFDGRNNRSPQKQQDPGAYEREYARQEFVNRQYENEVRNKKNFNSPNGTRQNVGASPAQGRNEGLRYSPMEQPLMFKLGIDGTPGWFLGDMRIPDPPRISQQDLVNYQQNQIDRKLNDAMNSSRTNLGRTVHVPISANFAVLDDNLIDDNVYYYEPSCLAYYLSELLDRFMMYYVTNESKFYAIDLLGAYCDLLRTRNERSEATIFEEASRWMAAKSQKKIENDIFCYMVHVTTSEETTKSNSSQSLTTSTNTIQGSAVASPITSTPSPFEGEMTTESIMAAIAFLQKAQNANALKEMTTGQKMMLRSVTETISDTANDILLEEGRGKEKTLEGVVGDILDAAVLTVSIRDINEKCEDTTVSKEGTSVVINPSKIKTSMNTIKEVLSGESEITNVTTVRRPETASTSSDTSKSPSLTEILDDLNNFKAPPTDLIDERKSDSTSPTKRTSARGKLAKEKEETLRMYEESSKRCDEVVDAIINNLEEASAPKSSVNEMATPTETVWIRTKAKVLPTTSDSVERSTTVPANTRDSDPAKCLPIIPVSTTAKGHNNPAHTNSDASKKSSAPTTAPSTNTTTTTTSVESSKRKTIRLADEQVRQLANKGSVRPSFLGTKRGIGAVGNNNNEDEGVLDYLVRTGIKETTKKRTEKPKITDSKVARTTPVKKSSEAVPDIITPTTESMSTSSMNEISGTKRQRKPTNRHSPSEANQQCQVLRKGDNRRQIPDLPTAEKVNIKVVTGSKNDPIIKIIELFGESDSDSEIKDIIQPNYVEACIWSESPVHESPTTSAVESDLMNEETAENPPMEIVMKHVMEDPSEK